MTELSHASYTNNTYIPPQTIKGVLHQQHWYPPRNDRLGQGFAMFSMLSDYSSTLMKDTVGSLKSSNLMLAATWDAQFNVSLRNGRHDDESPRTAEPVKHQDSSL